MGFFDFMKNKNKKTYTLGAMGMPPYLEVDLENRILKIVTGPFHFQDFPLDQVTKINGGFSSLTQGTLTVYVNGVVAKEMPCESFKLSELPDIERKILDLKRRP